jgi:hypothetical protein
MVRKLKRLDNDELFEMVELSVGGLNLFVPEYRKSRDLDFLHEIKIQAETAWTCAEELRRRLEGELVPGVERVEKTTTIRGARQY